MHPCGYERRTMRDWYTYSRAPTGVEKSLPSWVQGPCRSDSRCFFAVSFNYYMKTHSTHLERERACTTKIQHRPQGWNIKIGGPTSLSLTLSHSLSFSLSCWCGPMILPTGKHLQCHTHTPTHTHKYTGWYQVKIQALPLSLSALERMEGWNGVGWVVGQEKKKKRRYEGMAKKIKNAEISTAHLIKTHHGIQWRRGRLPVIMVWANFSRMGWLPASARLLWGSWSFLVVAALQLKLSPSTGWQRELRQTQVKDTLGWRRWESIEERGKT